MCPLKWNQISFSHMAGLRIFCPSIDRKVTDIAPTWFRSRTHQHSNFSWALMCFHSQQKLTVVGCAKKPIHSSTLYSSSYIKLPSTPHAVFCKAKNSQTLQNLHLSIFQLKTPTLTQWMLIQTPILSRKVKLRKCYTIELSVYLQRNMSVDLNRLDQNCLRLVQLTPRCQMWSWNMQPILKTLQNVNFLKHLPAQDPRVEIPENVIPHSL